MTYTAETGRAFWHEFDRITKYNDSFMMVASQAGAFNIQNLYADTRIAGTYPAAMLAFVAPRKAEWITIADVQTGVFRMFFQDNWTEVQMAFEDFGQGILFDADPVRQASNDSIHTMDVQGQGPPVGYHRWHASLRALQLLGIGDPVWWEKLDELVGLAWGLQSFGRPRQQLSPNPAFAAADMTALRSVWLGVSPDQRDRQFDLVPRLGYHPSPKQLVA